MVAMRFSIEYCPGPGESSADRILHLEDGHMKSLSEVVSEGTSRMLNLLKCCDVESTDSKNKSGQIVSQFAVTSAEQLLVEPASQSLYVAPPDPPLSL
jgi:hypothetical protein